MDRTSTLALMSLSSDLPDAGGFLSIGRTWWTLVMLPLIEANRSELQALCRRFNVRRLDLFGSAASGEFDPNQSDLDFLVEFFPESTMGPFRQYMDFLDALEKLFRCHVDLVEAQAMTNPYFVRAIQESRQLLYAA